MDPGFAAVAALDIVSSRAWFRVAGIVRKHDFRTEAEAEFHCVDVLCRGWVNRLNELPSRRFVEIGGEIELTFQGAFGSSRSGLL
jgi:hypothetical protein